MLQRGVKMVNSKSDKIFRLIQLCVVLVFCCTESGCSEQREKKKESIALPTGEIVTNESYLYVAFRDAVSINKLFFQWNASSPREFMGKLVEDYRDRISLHETVPQIYKNGDRTALIIGSNIFERWTDRQKPYWYHTKSKPDQDAKAFLRSFLKAGDSRISVPDEIGQHWFITSQTETPYAFDHIDLEQNILTTRRDSPDSTLPEFIIYSAVEYGFPWRFDIERTRNANKLKPPSDSNLFIDFSVVTYPGKLTLTQVESRDVCLSLSGAKEIYAQTVSLSSETWKSAQYTLTIPTGKVLSEQFDVLLGFTDPLPEYISIFLYNHRASWNQMHFIKIDRWILADSSGFEGDLAGVVFFRVRRAQAQ